MSRRALGGFVLGAALCLPTVALAKGPESASFTGPGLEQRSLTLVGGGEMGQGTALGALVDASGFFAQMYGDSSAKTLAARPRGTLGPHYRVTYVVPGPNGIRSRVVQDLYPFAKPAPLTYMRPGQHYWGNRQTLGGWYRTRGLAHALARAGLELAKAH